MNVAKKPKLRSGRVYRTVKLPVGMHEKLKAIAARNSKKVSSFYEEIISNFLVEIKVSRSPKDYLFHRGDVKNISIALSRELADAVKSLSETELVPETRIMFTAIVQFSGKIIA